MDNKMAPPTKVSTIEDIKNFKSLKVDSISSDYISITHNRVSFTFHESSPISMAVDILNVIGMNLVYVAPPKQIDDIFAFEELLRDISEEGILYNYSEEKFIELLVQGYVEVVIEHIEEKYNVVINYKG